MIALSLIIAGSESDPAVRHTVGSVLGQDVGNVEVIIGGPAPARRRQGWLSRLTHVHAVATPASTPPDELVAAGLEAARAAASGRWVGVLGAGDDLEPGALRAVMSFLAHADRLDVVYTDEQWPATGADGIATKPDFLPQYHQSYPYLGRLCVVRSGVLASAGGFRDAVPGAEEWDAQLRVTERTDRVGHLPTIAVTRAAAPPTDERARTAGLRAVQGRVERSGRPGRVEPTADPLGVRLWWTVEPPPLVSIVIPTAGGRRTVHGEEGVLLERCVRSLVERTTYQTWELVLVTSEGTPQDVIDRVRALVGDRFVHAPVSGPFSFSRSVNEGARHASGHHILLLNDDTEAVEPRWLDRMVCVAADPTVGAVGAKLLFEEGTLQHVGIIVTDDGTPIHPLGSEVDGIGRFATKEVDVDYLAVTGACLLTPRADYLAVGGFSEDLPLNFNDIDYCLKLVARGRTVVTAPFARLFHYESSTRGHNLDPWEQEYLERRWGLRLTTDPHVQYRSTI